jgi:hypothetical protein
MIITLFDRLAARLDSLRQQRTPALLAGAGKNVDAAILAADRLMGHLSANAANPGRIRQTSQNAIGDLRNANEDLAAHLAVVIGRLRKSNPLDVLGTASNRVPPRLCPTIGRDLMVAAGATGELVAATSDLLEGDYDHAADRLQHLLVTTLAVVVNTASLHKSSAPAESHAPLHSA